MILNSNRIILSIINRKIDLSSWNKNLVQIEAEIKIKARSRREAGRYLDKVEIIINKSAKEKSFENAC